MTKKHKTCGRVRCTVEAKATASLQAEVEQAAEVMQQMQGAEGGQPPGIPGQGGSMQ